MLTYETLKKKPKELWALTGLARREFDELLPAFAQALTPAEALAKPKPKKRRRAPGVEPSKTVDKSSLPKGTDTIASNRPAVGQRESIYSVFPLCWLLTSSA